MQTRMWVIGFFVGLAILILIAVLWSPLGALLGGMVLASAAAIGITSSHIIPVHQRTALVVLSTLHSAVLRVVPGPGTALLIPFWEKPGDVIDTSLHLEQVYIEDILQSDQQPAILRFTAYVIHQLAPQTIPQEALAELLPTLTGNLGGLVERWTDYFVRNLIADIDPSRLHNGSRSRLETRLTHLLEDCLGSMGIAVRGVQLVIWPPAGLHTTLTTAEQQRVSTTLQAEQVAALLEALEGQSDHANSLVLLELARSLGRDGPAWVSLDLAPLLSGDPGKAPSPATTQLPLLSGILNPVHRS